MYELKAFNHGIQGVCVLVNHQTSEIHLRKYYIIVTPPYRSTLIKRKKKENLAYRPQQNQVMTLISLDPRG